MVDAGNARIAALRSRLLGAADLRHLADVDGPEGFLAGLERHEDWRGVIRETAPLAGDPSAAIGVAIERHRSTRLGSLARWYDPPTRGLVEALVMPLDLERIVAILRRRYGGAEPAAVGATIVGGALLDVATLGRIARAPDAAGLARILVRSGVLYREAAGVLGPAVTRRDEVGELDREAAQRRLEDRMVAAFDLARAMRTAGRGTSARRVRAILAAERAERDEVDRIAEEAGPSTAWLVERSATLARLDALAHEGPRDPLGIGAVAGYVAALEAQAIRLRACLARVAAGWSAETFLPYLPTARS